MNIKQLQKEYEENKKQLKHLRNETEYLNEKGLNTFYKLKQRNEEIKKILEQEYVPIIAVDFDGVLNKYNGWNGERDLSVPQSGVEYFLKKLDDNFSVIIFTVRDTDYVNDWLIKYGLDKYVFHVTNMKPKAVAYIDDRAITYKGNYQDVLKQVENFKTWWE